MYGVSISWALSLSSIKQYSRVPSVTLDISHPLKCFTCSDGFISILVGWAHTLESIFLVFRELVCPARQSTNRKILSRLWGISTGFYLGSVYR